MLDCLYNSPSDALLLGHGVHVPVKTQQVHFYPCGSIAGNRYGAICYGCKLVVDSKFALHFCALRDEIDVQVYRDHEPVVAIVLSRDGNFSPVRHPEELFDQILPPKVSTIVRVIEVSGTGVVVLPFRALPGEFERVVKKKLFVHDHAQLDAQLREVGMDHAYGQSV